MEIYKDIIGYEGLYQFSNLGNVKSLARFDYAGHKLKERILVLHKTNKGYFIVCLSKNGGHKTYAIHRLVAEYHFGPCPEGLECRHLDGIPENLEPENLKYGTRSENMFDRTLHGTTRTKRVRCIETGKIFNSTREAERQTRIDHSNISRVCRGVYKTAGGYHWEFV